MSVDFSAAPPAQTALTGKPVDVQTLQETFTLALRSFGTEKGNSQTTTLLEVLRSSPADNVAGADRNQQRRETQLRTDKNDFTQIDRKQLGRAETRSNEMNADYRNRQDRQENLRNGYQDRLERTERRQPPPPPTLSATPVDTAKLTEPLPNANPPLPQQQNVSAVNTSEVAGANSPTLSATVAVPNTVVNVTQANMSMPVNVNTPVSMPMPTAPQPAAPQAFTVFTPSGRWGQQREKSEEDEEEKGERAEENPVKKKQPFAAFEAIRAETTRPVQKNVPRQSKGPAARLEQQHLAETSRERPREVEQNPSETVKTLDELLNTPSQNISTQTKGEPNRPNQTQYLNRIAAACEAAGQFAPIRIKINLDHLGTLTLRFFHKADRLALSFESPSRRSAQFLRDHIDELRTILSKRSVKIVDIEIRWEEPARCPGTREETQEK